MSVERQTGKTPEGLQDLIEPPTSCHDVLNWFWELHSSRGSNGFGPNPISFLEIKAYFDLISIKPLPWEIGLIKRLDNAYLEYSANQANKKNP